MNLKYDIQFKLKILDELKRNNFKNISKKYKLNINTLKSWYYKIQNEEIQFWDNKKKVLMQVEDNINFLLKIRNIYQNKKPNKAFKLINKIRKKNKISLKLILKELNISKSTYYEKLQKSKERNINKKLLQDKKDIKRIQQIFTSSRNQFGYRKIKKALSEKYNSIMNHKKILRLMKFANIVVGYLKRKTKKNDHKVGKNRFKILDLINREFNKIKTKLKVFYTDVTYHIWNRFRFYQTTIIDAFTKEIVDYQLSFRNDCKLIMKNLEEMLNRVKKTRVWN